MTAALRTEDVTAFAGAAEFTGVTSRDRTGWLALRRTMLTASDVASVLDLDDTAPRYRRSALAVYVEKVLEPEPDIVDLTPADFAAMEPVTREDTLRRLFNEARFWGSRLEQPILRTVSEYSGWRYREGGALLRSRLYPWLGCTLDAEIDRRGDGTWEDLEGKTTTLTREWDQDSGALPTHVIIQAQTQLLVTGAPVARVVALLQGSTTVQIEVEPDLAFHAIIAEESERFMARVRDSEPPPADWRESSAEALRRLYPTHDGAIVDLPPEAVSWTLELQQIAEEFTKLERRKAMLRNALKHRIGAASYGLLPAPVGDKSCWRWGKNKAGQDVLLALKRVPRRARPYGFNGAAVANDPLTAALEASLEDDTISAAPIRFGNARRRSRR